MLSSGQRAIVDQLYRSANVSGKKPMKRIASTILNMFQVDKAGLVDVYDALTEAAKIILPGRFANQHHHYTAEVKPSPNYGAVWVYRASFDMNGPVAQFHDLATFEAFVGMTIEEFNK